jgi:hypothetical protein
MGCRLSITFILRPELALFSSPPYIRVKTVKRILTCNISSPNRIIGNTRHTTKEHRSPSDYLFIPLYSFTFHAWYFGKWFKSLTLSIILNPYNFLAWFLKGCGCKTELPHPIYACVFLHWVIHYWRYYLVGHQQGTIISWN